MKTARFEAARTAASILVLSTIASAGNAQFTVESTYSVLSVPREVAIGDVDHDGIPDLVAPAEISNDVKVLYGSTGYLTQNAYGASGDPYSVAVADLRRDGNLDIVVSNSIGGSVSYYIGDGTGAFTWITDYGVESSPTKIAVGDMNGDGLPDIVTMNFNSKSVSEIFSTANGFAHGVAYPIAGSPSGMALGDLNGDGSLDVVTGVIFTKYAVFTNNGSGNLSNLNQYALPHDPESIALGDVSSDGLLDLVVTELDTGNLAIALGNGAGSFGTPTEFPAGAPILRSAVADLDGDGKLDVASSFSFHGLSVVHGFGDGTFAAPSVTTISGNPWAITVGDLNADGMPDLVLTYPVANTIAVFLNQTAAPTGLATFGHGTPGCAGVLAMSASASPLVNSPSFGLTCTNAPTSAVGLGILANVPDAAGTDSFGLGFVLHVDLVASTFVFSLNFQSDIGGTSFAPAPIPNNPTLSGVTIHAQSVWFEDLAAGAACGPSPFHLISSKGLSLTFQ